MREGDKLVGVEADRIILRPEVLFSCIDIPVTSRLLTSIGSLKVRRRTAVFKSKTNSSKLGRVVSGIRV